MSDHFEKIPTAEQAYIVQTAVEEFAEKGYRFASTNSIVKKAGIPKGTLFYYFGSKKDLFLYILDGAIETYVAFVGAEKSQPPEELFERLMHRQQVKLRFAAAYPLLFRFFSKVFLDIPEEIREELGSRFSAYSAASADNLTKGIDLAPFRRGVNVSDATKMITILLEGVFSHYALRLKAAEPDEFDTVIQEISAECQRYFNLIRKGIYD